MWHRGALLYERLEGRILIEFIFVKYLALNGVLVEEHMNLQQGVAMLLHEDLSQECVTWIGDDNKVGLVGLLEDGPGTAIIEDVDDHGQTINNVLLVEGLQTTILINVLDRLCYVDISQLLGQDLVLILLHLRLMLHEYLFAV